MLRKAFSILFIILATASADYCQAKQTFEPTTERWTIKIRGGRDAAETIARERGFEVYHEFKELPGIFTLQRVGKLSGNGELEDVNVPRNFLKDQFEAIWEAKANHINLQPKIYELIRRTTKGIRNFFRRIRKFFHL